MGTLFKQILLLSYIEPITGPNHFWQLLCQPLSARTRPAVTFLPKTAYLGQVNIQQFLTCQERQSKMQNQYSFLFKYIIIGDASVGKSCILMQFLQNKFKIDSETTVGVEFGSKIIEIGSEKIKLQIWDTAGQETFKSITRSYYRGSIGAVLVYDTTNRESFSNLSKWVEETKNYANEKLSVILVGNKIDLEHKRVISTSEGREFADKNKMLFLQCSAKNDTSKIFQDLASQILRKVEKKQIDPRNETLGIKIGTFRSGKLLDEPRGSFCC